MSSKYKPVFPAGLLDERQEIDMSFKQKVGNNLTLKVGAVLEIVELDDDKNQSKLVPEYNVMVVEDENTSIYKNCMAIDTFGGIADYLRFKRRTPKKPKEVQDSGSLKDQTGSIVLLLCLDGAAESAIVVGALAHPNKKNVLTKDKEHHMEGEFNGINFSIDKDGALRVEFKSATDDEGKPQDEEAGGSYQTFEKDGSIEISDGNEEKVRIDKTNKTIDVMAEEDITVASSKANVMVTAEKNIDMKSTKELLMEASGNAMLKTAKELKLEASNSFEAKGATVKIKGDSQATIDATQIQLKGSSIQVGSGGSPAVTSSTVFIGTGNLGGPVVCSAVGPFSSSVFIAS